MRACCLLYNFEDENYLGVRLTTFFLENKKEKLHERKKCVFLSPNAEGERNDWNKGYIYNITMIPRGATWYHGTYYNKTKLYYYIAFCRGFSSYFYVPHAFPTIYKSTFVCSNPPMSYLFSSPQIKALSN